MLELALALIAVGGLVAAFGGGQVSAALLAGAVGVAAVVRPAGLRRHRAARRARRQPGPRLRAVRDQVPDGLGPGRVRARAHPDPQERGLPDRHRARAAVALVSYVVGWRHIREGQPLPPTLGARVRSKVKERRRALKDHEDLPLRPTPGARRR